MCNQFTDDILSLWATFIPPSSQSVLKELSPKKLSACHHRVPPCGPFKQPPQSPPMLLCTNMIATYIMYLFTAPPENIFNVFISLFLGGGTCKSLPPPNQKDSSSSCRSVDFVKWRTTGSLTVINKRLQEASSSQSSSDHHHHHHHNHHHHHHHHNHHNHHNHHHRHKVEYLVLI